MMRLSSHVRNASAKAKEHLPAVKRHAKRAWKAWQVITLVLLSAVFVPVFLRQGTDHNFYALLVPGSILIYLVVTFIHLKLKPGFVKWYLESTATRLFLGLVSLAAAFLFLGVGLQLWGRVLLAASAVLYASFLQQVGFLRVIGL
jgi:hypothetical protein